MKVLVILSLAALCFAQSTYVGKHVTVRDDGVITIVGDEGREIDIHQSLLDPRKVDLILKAPLGLSRRIQVDEANNIHNIDLDTSVFPHFTSVGNYITQHDVLVHLFGKYQGLVDAIKYEELLQHIHHLVKIGVLHDTIGQIFRNYFAQQLQEQPWISHYETYAPLMEEYSVKQYSPEYIQKVTPLQRLYSLLQQHQFTQGHSQEFYPQQQYNPVHKSVYEIFQHPYGQYQGHPWAKLFYNLQHQQLTTGEQSQYPYQWQYQTPLREYLEYQQQYPQGYYNQNQYSQGNYNQQDTQGYYHHQQYLQSQAWNPEEYTHYQQQGFYGKIPLVY